MLTVQAVDLPLTLLLMRYQEREWGGGGGGVIKSAFLLFSVIFFSCFKFLKCKFKERVITFCNGHSSNGRVICNENILRPR